MSEYAKKTCYDCGIRKPAPYMERVTESYTSGQSNTKVTAGNLVFGALGDKRGQNAVGRAIKGNNRRQYTRNRTVWKCMDCSGTNDWHRSEVRKDINSAIKSIAKAQKGGVFAAPKNLPSEVHNKMHALKELDGTTSSRVSQDLRKNIEALIKSAPDADKSKFEKVLDKYDQKLDNVNEKLEEKIAAMEEKHAERQATIDANSAIIAKARAERRRLSSTEVKIINFVLKIFECAGWFLVGLATLGVALGSEPAGGFVVGSVGLGWALLMRKLKR